MLLPETTNKDITEILDVSPVYLFYDETQPDSIEFNRKNMISTTNWLVNIDKRLTLKQILPHLQYLQDKRHSDGMHKNKSAKNYFTCSNTDLENLSFIEFTDIVYNRESSIDYFSKKINIKFPSSDRVNFLSYINDGIIVDSTTKDGFLKALKSIAVANKEQINIILNFSQDLIFQDYISYKTLLLELNIDNVIVANDEFIYN